MPTPQTAHVINPDELAYFSEVAETWTADNDQMRVWLQKQAMILLQVLQKIALTPPAGRSGNAVQVSAIRDFYAQAEKVLNLISAQRAPAAPETPQP